jgi:hypothetical protein
MVDEYPQDFGKIVLRFWQNCIEILLAFDFDFYIP